MENLAGSTREGKDANGKPWKIRMKNHYGEILGTKGTDKDKLDVYLGPNPKSKRVFVVHQNHPGTHPSKAGRFDEDKICLAFNTPEQAKKAYLAHYNRKDFFRSITEWDLPKFKKAIFGENKGDKVASIVKKALSYRGHVPAEERALLQEAVDELREQNKPRTYANWFPIVKRKWEERAMQSTNKVAHWEQVKEAACKTPGKKIRSKGKGRGLGVGKGKGPLVHKLREFSSSRKKKDAEKRKSSAFIREHLRGK